MSDHPPAQAAAHASGGSSTSGKVWKAVGITISVMLAVILLFWVVGFLLYPAANGIEQVKGGVKAINTALFGMQNEVNQALITLVQIFVLPVVLFLIIKYWALK